MTLVPILYGIGNHALHTSVLHVYGANLTGITNTSFPLSIEGQVKKTGIFPAHLYFREPVQVYWRTALPENREVLLGTMVLDYIGVAAGHGRIQQATVFNVMDQDAFGLFTAFLLSEPEFTWQLRCPNVHVEAFSVLPTFKNLEFVKNVVFEGINGFTDVKVLDFQLPGDDPAGGITTQVVTQLFNPSPFGIQVGTLILGLYYQNVFLGNVRSDDVNITTGLNTVIISGQLIPHLDNTTELDLIGQLFTGYINGEAVPVEARGVSTQQANGDVISWLAAGITALTVQVPLQSPEPIDPIKGITIDYLSLIYSTETPYNPIAFSDSLVGNITLPFGFSLDIISLSNAITLLYQGASVAILNAPYSDSETRLNLISAGQTSGSIDITLPQTPLLLPNDTEAARQQLVNFQSALVYESEAGVTLSGSAKALTDTPIGRVLLDGIKFEVGSGLYGLEGLLKYPTVINSVDVVGGVPDGIELMVATTIVNPSNLNISVGDTTFNLGYQDVLLGNVTLPNLILEIGRVDSLASSYFDANRAPQGLDVLNRFISGQTTQVDITGFAGSSAVESLNALLGNIHLNATLPALSQNLVQSANLTVLDTTGITDSVANSIVFLANPFTSGLTINSISANASSKGIFIANIDTPLNFPAAGKVTSQSPNVPLTLNLYPPDIFGLLRGLVVQSGQDPTLLDGLVQLGGYAYTPTTAANGNTPMGKRDLEALFVREEENEMAEMLMGVASNPGALADGPSFRDDGAEFVKRADAYLDHQQLAERILSKRDNMYTGFNLETYVDAAFAVATLDLTVQSAVTIGSYDTVLTFSQNDVALGTDDSLNLLLPVLAAPIVQKIVDTAILNIDRLTILSPQATTFTVSLQGTITNSGPFDAVISFPEGLEIYWNGQLLVQTSFPDVSLTGDTGAALNVEITAQVPSVDYLTTFTEFLLTQPSFVWSIRGTGLSVAALGITVPGITITKDVQLTGFNGLQGMVIINSFDLPANDPAGGITLTAVSTINSPAQVGVELSRFGTNIVSGGVAIGPAAAQAPFILQALAVTDLPLAGRLIEQTSTDGLAALSNIFTRFVQNTNTDVTVNGDFAGPEEVAWLNNGIKVLSVTVSLPAQDFQVIRLISINQLSLFFTTATAYSPATSSTQTVANFFLPFAFPLDITQTGGGFIANYNGQQTAVLNIPFDSPGTTDVEARILTLSFTNVPFEVYSDAQGTFSQFLADTTMGDVITFNLNGQATAVANTAAGAVTISDIPFNVDTNIRGLQGLNARPAVTSNLDVVHGYPTYLLITADVALFNPSAITIGTGDVGFAVLFQNNPIGIALIDGLILVPGTNIVPTQINYAPQGTVNTASGQLLLENYVSNITSNALVAGTDQTTNIESLVQALSSIRLSTDIPSLMRQIVRQAALVVPPEIAQTGIAAASVVIDNPFTASINIINLAAQAIYFGPSNYGDIILGTINQDLTADPLANPGKTVTTSRQIPIALNIDPINLIQFIFTAAANTGTDLGPFPAFLNQIYDLPTTDTQVSPYPYFTTLPCNSGTQFDILGAILRLLQGLQTTIPIQSTLKLDDYQTNLNFQQSPVPTVTDNTALYLVGPAAAPLIQLTVDQAVLFFNRANATNLVDTGFDVALEGFLTVTAPADAYISFPDGIIVDWMGDSIANIALPPICSAASVGVPNYITQGHLTITNQDRFIDFAEYILKNPSFTWTIHSPTVVVQAVGITFSNVILTKDITIDVFNGLPGIVITYFDIPSDQTDPNALNIVANANIPSPSALGVELGTANFEIFFQGTDVGPISATNLFLAPKPQNGVPGETDTLAMTTGMIQDQRGDTTDLANLGVLFSQFLAGTNSTLQLTGVSVISPTSNGQPVSWLTAAFKTFTTDAILPGMIYQIIYAITLSDLTAIINADTTNNNAQPYTIDGTNQQTIAVFANPFRFGLTPIEAGPSITLTYQGVDTAQIDLLEAPVTAGTSSAPDDFENLILNFQNQTIQSLNDASFTAFLAALADTTGATFGLKGSTSVLAGTVIGNIPITGIPFDVTTQLTGINSFNGVFSTDDLVVENGNAQYIEIPLNAILTNPSNLTIYTDAVSLPIVYTGANVYNTSLAASVYVGRAVIDELGLVPGQNTIATVFEYMPDDPNSGEAQDLLRRYLQPVDGAGVNLQNPYEGIKIQINGQGGGTQALSPYGVLVPAFQGLLADGTILGLGTRVAHDIEVFLDANVILSAAVGTVNGVLDALPGVGTLLGGVVSGITGQDSTAATVSALINGENDLGPDAVININRLQTLVYGGNDGALYASFDNTFDPAYTINPGGALQKSAVIPDIMLTMGEGLVGLVASLPLIGQPLTIDNTIQTHVGSDGDGYNIPSLRYYLQDVPATYEICIIPATATTATCFPLVSSADLGDGTLAGLITALTGLFGTAITDLLGAAGALTNLLQQVLQATIGGGSFTTLVNTLLANGVTGLDLANALSPTGATSATNLLGAALTALSGSTALTTVLKGAVAAGGDVLDNLADVLTTDQLNSILGSLTSAQATSLLTAITGSGQSTSNQASLVGVLQGTFATLVNPIVCATPAVFTLLVPAASCTTTTSGTSTGTTTATTTPDVGSAAGSLVTSVVTGADGVATAIVRSISVAANGVTSTIDISTVLSTIPDTGSTSISTATPEAEATPESEASGLINSLTAGLSRR